MATGGWIFGSMEARHLSYMGTGAEDVHENVAAALSEGMGLFSYV